MKRIHKKLTPEESARYQKLAERVEREDREQIAEAARQIRAGYSHLRDVLGMLVEERQKKGITLSELARRVGIDKGNLARLESGAVPNPTIGTVQRIADALGKDVAITLRDKPAA